MHRLTSTIVAFTCSRVCQSQRLWHKSASANGPVASFLHHNLAKKPNTLEPIKVCYVVFNFSKSKISSKCMCMHPGLYIIGTNEGPKTFLISNYSDSRLFYSLLAPPPSIRAEAPPLKHPGRTWGKCTLGLKLGPCQCCMEAALHSQFAAR